MGWLAGYNNRIKISIDAAKIDEALSDFPVLVKLTSANFDFAAANSDGHDIRFTSSDGTTFLKYERERHDSANELAEYWVKVPSVSDSADTYIYLYYRTEDTADGADGENVWDSNYKAVHHFKDNTTSSVLDSTSNNNDGTKKGANEPVEAAGQIYKAQDFDGINDYIDFGTTADLRGDIVTLEYFFKPDGEQDSMMANWNTGAESPPVCGYWSTDKAIIYLGANYYYYINHPIGANDGNWHMLTFVITGGKQNDVDDFKIYLDGVVLTSPSIVKTGSQSAKAGFVIGAAKSTPYAWQYDGLIDEFRYSNVVRSAAWIKASYHAVADSLLSFYPQIKPGSANFFMLFN